MENFTFNSPGVKIKEINNTGVNIPTVGITPTGIVGEFPKGPAFEKILIQDKSSFIKKFGDISSEKLNNKPKYLGNYYASSYFEEGNTLYTTRVLGLSGYDAGDAWVLTLKQPSGSTTVDIDTSKRNGSTVVAPYSNFTYLVSSSTLTLNSPAYDISNVSYDNINSTSIATNSIYHITPLATAYTKTNNTYFATGTSFNFTNVNKLTNGVLNMTATTNTLSTTGGVTDNSSIVADSFIQLYVSVTNQSIYIGANNNSNYSNNHIILNNITINDSTDISYNTVSNLTNFKINGTPASSIFSNVNATVFSSNTANNFVTGKTNGVSQFTYTTNYYSDTSGTLTDFTFEYVINIVNGSLALYNTNAVTQVLTTTNVKTTGVSYSYNAQFQALELLTSPSSIYLSVPAISSAFTVTPDGFADITTYSNLGDTKVSYTFKNLSDLTSNVYQGNLALYTYNYECKSKNITSYINQVVGTIRGAKKYVNNSLINQVSNISFSVDNSADPLSMFTITVFTASGNQTYRATLDPTSDSFIGKVLPKELNANYNIYLESLFSNLITNNLTNNIFVNNAPSLTKIDTTTTNKQYSDYKATYQTPETPYVVSNLNGSLVKRLFKFISISDGNSANSEIKISIENIDFTDNSFTVVIRDFNDTDSNKIILEQFDKCNLDSLSNNYVLRKIGGVFESDLTSQVFDINSSYVYLVLCDDVDSSSVPSGFEGYTVRSYTNMLSPSLVYKTKYTSSDVTNKTYLGLNKIDLDLMKFIGNIQTDETTSKTKGFHFDSNADTDIFEIGVDSFNAIDTQNTNNKYNKKTTRKFTLALAGGFDGWDIFRTSRTTGIKDSSDYNAYLAGIQTFIGTEDIKLDLFATPGINFSDDSSLVQEAITLVENRDDCFYVIDSPYLPNSVSLATQIVDLLESTDIDTSYAATYFSHIGVTDPNTKQNIFIPATGEVIRVMTLTDKIRKPWFAPAGVNRSVIKNAKSVVRSFTAPERDILQLGRINPIVKFNTYGIDIFGQRTLLNGTTNNLLTKINVRRLLNYIKKELKDIALLCIFDQNEQSNVNTFLDKANTVLSMIQREKGLNKFVLSVDNDLNTPENIDRGLMFFTLNLYPTSATEGIGITFNINPSDSTIKFTNG